MFTVKEKNDGDCSVYEYGSLVAGQPVRGKRENPTKKETQKFSTSLLYKSSSYFYFVTSRSRFKKIYSTSLQVESK